MMFYVLCISGDSTGFMQTQTAWTNWRNRQALPGLRLNMSHLGSFHLDCSKVEGQITTFDYCRHYTILIISINSHQRPRSLGFYLHARHRVLELAVTFTVFNVLPVSAAPPFTAAELKAASWQLQYEDKVTVAFLSTLSPQFFFSRVSHNPS